EEGGGGWFGRLSGLARRGVDGVATRLEVQDALKLLAVEAQRGWRSHPDWFPPQAATILRQLADLDTRASEVDARVRQLEENTEQRSGRVAGQKAQVSAAEAAADKAGHRYRGLVDCP